MPRFRSIFAYSMIFAVRTWRYYLEQRSYLHPVHLINNIYIYILINIWHEFRLINCIHLIRSLWALRIANLFFFPPRTRLVCPVGLLWQGMSPRCADSRGVRGPGSTSSSRDGMAASLMPRMYRAGEISERVGCLLRHAVSSFITQAIYMFKLFRDKSRILMAKMYVTFRGLSIRDMIA